MLRSLLYAALLLAALDSVAAPVDQQRLRDAQSSGADWLAHGRDLQETRFSPLTGVTSENVAQLGLAWYVDLPDTRGLQATPLVADGVMYVTGNWSVTRAYEAASGELLWEYDPGVDRTRAGLFCCGVVNRGVALYRNRVYLGTLDGYLVAIDRATGREQWRTLTIDQDRPYSITGAPRAVGGVIVIGNGGSEFGVRGYVGAYDPDSGAPLWRFYTVPGNPADGFESPLMEKAARTWSGQWWTMGGGGTVWDSLAYDPELDLLYVGVGNGGPHNHKLRSPGGGDNLFLASVVALRPRSGEYVWHHQQNPGESWDYTATQQMVLADLPWQGEVRKVLMQAPKNGFFFIYDRATGELLSAEPYVPATWATGYNLQTGRPLETENARYEEGRTMLRPSGLGGHNWHSMAWHPQTGLMYIPAQDFPGVFEDVEDFRFVPNHWNLGYQVNPSSFGALLTRALVERLMNSYLLAWDPAKQREAWRVPTPLMGNGGVLATGGGLVFQGTTDGLFRAYDADKGTELWRFDANHGINAAPISYAVDGVQYISVLAGRGGGLSQNIGLAGGSGETSQRRLLSFALGKSQVLPPPALVQRRSEPPPAGNPDPEAIERGARSYTRYCSRCHGADLRSDGSIPDLRRLDNQWYERFHEVVLQGSMLGMGMPAFDDVLQRRDVDNILAYVLDQAGDDWANQRSPHWWMAIKQWFAELAAAVLLWLL